MGNFALGFKALFRIWSDAPFAENVQELLEGKSQPVAAPAPVETKPTPAPEPVLKRKEPTRSEALTLLSVLQREARMVDFFKESIAAYTDAQIGAAVRSIHKDCAAVLERMFALQPMRSESEGASIDVAAGFDPAQFRLVGNIPEQPPFRGKIAHAGWIATKCEVPEWTGREESSMVVAPVEVELA
jgi:hypothetical protein